MSVPLAQINIPFTISYLETQRQLAYLSFSPDPAFDPCHDFLAAIQRGRS